MKLLHPADLQWQTVPYRRRTMSNFRIKTMVLGMVSTNCYLVYNDDTKEGVVVDPADNGAYILNKCSELGVTPVAVLLTHGHFDHIGGSAFFTHVYLQKNEKMYMSIMVIKSSVRNNRSGSSRGKEGNLFYGGRRCF